MSTMAVHPVADLFPMLADDELQELADDIKTRGLLQPIVLDKEGRILDGRNRRAACVLAGVEPTFVTYSGDDTDGYAWSINIKRRNLTKAQSALLAADRFAGKDLPTRVQAEAAGVSHPMIVWAQAVRRYQDLHDEVLRGSSLNDAYATAQRRDEAEARRLEAIGKLRDRAPDLLAVVDDDRMTLDDAIAALEARDEKSRQEADAARTEEQRLAQKAKEEQRDARALLRRAVDLIAPSGMSDGFAEAWAAQLGEVDTALIDQTERAADVLLELVKRVSS